MDIVDAHMEHFGAVAPQSLLMWLDAAAPRNLLMWFDTMVPQKSLVRCDAGLLPRADGTLEWGWQRNGVGRAGVGRALPKYGIRRKRSVTRIAGRTARGCRRIVGAFMLGKISCYRTLVIIRGYSGSLKLI